MVKKEPPFLQISISIIFIFFNKSMTYNDKRNRSPEHLLKVFGKENIDPKYLKIVTTNKKANN